MHFFHEEKNSLCNLAPYCFLKFVDVALASEQEVMILEYLLVLIE